MRVNYSNNATGRVVSTAHFGRANDGVNVTVTVGQFLPDTPDTCRCGGGGTRTERCRRRSSVVAVLKHNGRPCLASEKRPCSDLCIGH